MNATHLPFKNLAGALLFTVFLGPIGLLYASSAGGIIMLLMEFFAVCNQFYVAFFILWLFCSVWGVLATNRYNKKILRSL